MNNASLRPGMGAIPYQDANGAGTTFRVWAKFATQVYVSGSFNNWSKNTHPLSPDGNDGYWSVDIAGVLADTGVRYRYIIEGPFIQGQQSRTDPYCKSVENNATSDGGIISPAYDWSGDHFSAPSWNELVIYELHVASFNRNANIQGNFDTIKEKLPYLAGLGINAIQIMPIFGFAGTYSLGYNPAFPFDIESSYGKPAQFKDFIKAAHSLGIAIIMDIVLNHFGPEDLDDSLRRPDGWYENGKSGIYFYNDWRGDTAFGDRPDYGREEVRRYLRDNVMMWLEEYRVDGLRFDSTVNIRNARGKNNDPGNDLTEGWQLMQHLNGEIDDRMPWKITIAEDLQNNEWITKSISLNGAGFDSQWDSTFFWALNNAVTAVNDADRNMNDVSAVLMSRFEGDFVKRNLYINNHDECAEINHKFRLTDRIWMGRADSRVVKKKYTLAAAIVFTAPGIPLIFQGDEFLEWGSWRPESTLDWNKLLLFPGITNLFSSLIRLRRNWHNNTRGLKGAHINVFHTNNNDKLIAYHRWENGGPGDDVVVVANFANNSYESYTIGFPHSGTWYVRFNSDWNGYSADFGNTPGYDTTTVNLPADGMPCSGNVGIGPYSVLILSQ